MTRRPAQNGSSPPTKRRSARRQDDYSDATTTSNGGAKKDPEAFIAGETVQLDNDSRMSTADQLSYWAEISADDNGMLGGYPQVSRIDIRFSRNFLLKLPRLYPDNTGKAPKTNNSANNKQTPAYQFRRCLESGAGIGRVTLNLLASMCETIDIVEPQEKFTNVLTRSASPLVKSRQLRRVYNVPLQEWTSSTTPSYESAQSHTDKSQTSNGEEATEQYDLIFNQWCLTYLPHAALVSYFRHLTTLLAPHGWIIVKENLSTAQGGEDMYWEEDSSVTRSDTNWRRSFEDSGLRVVRTELQTGFPKSLLPVRMYALRP